MILNDHQRKMLLIYLRKRIDFLHQQHFPMFIIVKNTRMNMEVIQTLISSSKIDNVRLELMKSINDLRIVDFDYLIAKDNQVALRYSAEGSHCGEPYKGIKPSGRKAKWTAAALFQLNQQGKITL